MSQPSTAYAPAPARPLPERTLHFTNGDLAADRLRRAGLAGTVSVYADVLYEGPAPANLSPQRWRRVRARHLAESGYEGYEQCLARLTAWDGAFDRIGDYQEVVLWFEPDLFDQLLLIRLLSRLAGEISTRTSLSLVSSVSPIGPERFKSFGAMAPEQMAALVGERQPLGKKTLALAGRAFKAFTHDSPEGIEAFLLHDTSALPFLAAAFLRHLEEFPATGNGLSRTEQQALVALAEADRPPLFEDLFDAVQEREECPFLTDLSLLRLLRHLASGPRPLLRLTSERHGLRTRSRACLTPAGAEVLAEREDWVHLSGIDRWLGGVHLQGPEAAWRWDAKRSRLVESA